MRLLIADDDRITARMLEGLTKSWGHEVRVVNDGSAALAELQGGSPPQLALLDWVMPGRDGPEVCARVRERQAVIPTYIILLTSRNAVADVVTGLEAGADDYLVKPFNPEELRARLNAGIRIVELQQRLAAQVVELESALASVRLLKGLLPICSYCKAIRNDSDYWQKVEEYVSDHSEAEFTHSICPKCLASLTASTDDGPAGPQS
jgi:phosphoserine phosphatase RsbU/P